MLPDDPISPLDGLRRLSAERLALDVAYRWAAIAPFYGGQPLTARERALMRLALRCYTHPASSAAALEAMQNEESL